MNDIDDMTADIDDMELKEQEGRLVFLQINFIYCSLYFFLVTSLNIDAISIKTRSIGVWNGYKN